MTSVTVPSPFCYGTNVLANNIGQHCLRYAGVGGSLVPALVMSAGRGGILGDNIAEKHALIPMLTEARVEATGHMIPWRDEEGFYRAYAEFLGVNI